MCPLWPGCPSLWFPLGLRRDFVLRYSREAILSWKGGILLLLLFFSRFPDELDVSSSSSSSSLMRSFATASSDFVEASSYFRLCISTSFWLMTQLRRPISSVFSESDFSSFADAGLSGAIQHLCQYSLLSFWVQRKAFLSTWQNHDLHHLTQTFDLRKMQKRISYQIIY